MKVTIAHNRSRQEVIGIVDRSLDDAFRAMGGGLLQVTDTQKSWTGDTMNFSMTAKAGFLTAPVRGTVLVSGTDVTIDADLGILGKLITDDKAKSIIENRVKGLLT
jgi:hypothetical protein